MKKFDINRTARQSRLVAPVFGGALGGLCPQAVLVGTHAMTSTRDRQVSVPSAGTAAAAMGHRSWSPPIT
jgi:hypothetical protein